MIINPKRALDEGWIKGVAKPEEQLQQNGIDIRVDEIWQIFMNGRLYVNEKTLPEKEKIELVDFIGKKMFPLFRMNAYIVISMENVEIPANVAALVIMRSTLNRMGAPTHSALYDSGFRGKIQPTIYPFCDIMIEPNARFAQIVFIEAQSASIYKGQYQDQGLKTEDAHPPGSG